MENDEATTAARLRDEAVAWMRRLGAPDYTDHVQASFMEWIHADPRHECAFREAALLGLPPGPEAGSDSIAADAGGDLLETHAEDRCDICGHALYPLASGDVLDLRSKPTPEPDPSVLAEARDWVGRLAGGVSPAYYQDLRAWLRGDARRRAAYLQALSGIVT